MSEFCLTIRQSALDVCIGAFCYNFFNSILFHSEKIRLKQSKICITYLYVHQKCYLIWVHHNRETFQQTLFEFTKYPCYLCFVDFNPTNNTCETSPHDDKNIVTERSWDDTSICSKQKRYPWRNIVHFFFFITHSLCGGVIKSNWP